MGGLGIGTNLFSKLNLRPQNNYNENIEAIERISDLSFEEFYSESHPRVFHEVFKEAYMDEQPSAKVDSEALEQMKDILEENSEKNPSWLNEKLFNLGYSKRVYGPENLRDLFSNPSVDFGPDMLPENDSILLTNPYREGHQQRKGDIHYDVASKIIANELSETELRIE